MSKYTVDNSLVDTHNYLDSEQLTSTLSPASHIHTVIETAAEFGVFTINLLCHLLILGLMALAVYQLSYALLWLLRQMVRPFAHWRQRQANATIYGDEKKEGIPFYNDTEAIAAAAAAAATTASSTLKTPPLSPTLHNNDPMQSPRRGSSSPKTAKVH